MNQFLKFVLEELLRFLLLLLPVALAAGGGLLLYARRYRRKHGGPFPWFRALTRLALAGYLMVLLLATVLRGSSGPRGWNLQLFLAWREAWNVFSVQSWANILLNIALFVPLGLLLPMVSKRLGKWTVPAGFLLSLGVELAQLGLSIGTFDVDDLFTNTLGTLLGFCLWAAGAALVGKRWKRALVPGGIFVGICAAVAGIFLVYSLQEFGNLPIAPVTSVDTGAIQWRLDCTLPQVGPEAPVYHTQMRTKADCDAFAQSFRTDFPDVGYYQEEAYYMDHSDDGDGAHILIVSYQAPRFEYTHHPQVEPDWAEADRAAITAALEGYPVTIPEAAEFSCEGEGWHLFWAEQLVTAEGMYDGALRCRYGADGAVYEVRNYLSVYEFYRNAPIRTPEEALESLYAGDFRDYGLFHAPGEVHILDCQLDYAVDTKGFCQPVYRFDLSAPGGEGQVMIPALT